MCKVNEKRKEYIKMGNNNKNVNGEDKYKLFKML